jgi:adenine-specific DNA-methyltransferase
MKKLDAQSPETKSADIVAGNVAALKVQFPAAFTEDRIDFEALKQLLGGAVDERDEKYGLNWHGKRRARQIALTPSNGTLLPCPKESVDWETTQNLAIEGDNLEVLKLLQKSYAGKVKLIYIDPPYNTDGDFIYPDRYNEGLDSYLRYTGQKVNGQWVVSESLRDTAGRKHSNWLSMMYPRIKLARALLRNDGFLLIHIDEHEVANAINLVSEIFGEENFLGPIVWDKRNPKGDATRIAVQHEYILVFAKRAEVVKDIHPLKRNKGNAERMLSRAAYYFGQIGQKLAPDDISKVVKKYNLELDIKQYARHYILEDAVNDYQAWLNKQDISGGEAAYKYIDENGDVFRTVSMAWPNKKKAPDDYFIPLNHPDNGQPCPVPDRGWRNPPDTMKRLLAEGKIVFGKDHTKQPERKYPLKENLEENIPSVLPYGGSDDALLAKLEIPFDNPKPLEFVKQLIRIFAGRDGTVLDFFAGSGTVGHACIELVREGGHQNRFILVQLPEPVVGDKRLDNIFQITRKRVKKASILAKNGGGAEGRDYGFRVYKLDQSNIKAWNPDPSGLEATLLGHMQHLVSGRSDSEVLYELLLKLGLDLCIPIATRDIAGEVVYSVGDGALIVCLADVLTKENVESLASGIVAWWRELAPAVDTRLVFKDSGFVDDITKSNMAAILTQCGISDIRSL